jgi:hypothetical protein
MKQFMVLLLAALLGTFTGAVSTGAQAQNGVTEIEVSNGDFEDGLKDWGLRHGPEKAYSVLTEGAFEGKQSAQIVLEAGSTPKLLESAYFSRVNFPTEAGYYRLRYAAKTDLTQGSFGAAIIAQDAEKKNVLAIAPGKGGVPSTNGKTDWKEYSLIYRLPENIAKVVLQMQVTNGLGTIALDDVRLERLDEKTGKMMMNEQSPQAPTLAEAGAQLLTAPCRIINARLGTLYRDPVTGRTNLALNSCTPGQGSGLLIDYQAGKTDVVPFPVGVGGWDLIQTAPDQMLFESLGPLYVVPVDLKTKKIIEEGMKPVPGNDYAWRFTQGSDGWIYMGSYPTAHLYRYHPKTYEVQDLGLMGPEGNLYNRQVAATKDGWVLSSVMMDKSSVVAYNPQTKEQFVVENAVNDKGETVGATVIAVGGEVYANVMGSLHQFDGAQKKFVPAKLPPAPEDAKWTYIVPSSSAERKVLRASNGTYYLLENGKEPLPVWNLNLRGGSLVGVDEKNRVLGFRGQDYFVAEPMAQEIKPIQVAENPPPVGIHFLRADPEGGVTGGPNFGQTLFRFDPARDLLQNTPQVVDGGGEVYDGRWVDGKFYFIAYGGGDIAVWDPKQPWDQWNNKNPKHLYTYKGDKDGNQIRPIGGLVVGPQGRLYSGWSAKYGKKGGGLGEWDIATNTARSWTNDIIEPEVSIGSIAADDKYVYGVTSNHFSGIKPPSKPLTFWAFDPIAEKVVFKQKLENVTGRPAVVRVPGTGHIWLADPNGLQRFDSQTLKFAQTIAWPREAGAPATISASDARGNTAWFTAGEVVVRLDDGAAPKATAIFGAEKPVGNLAAGVDGKLYFTQGVDVWSVPQKTMP